MENQQPIQGKSFFLDLPTEIRLIIYGYAWDQSKRSVGMRLSMSCRKPLSTLAWIYHDSQGLATASALMRTCNRVYAEVRDLVYSTTKFHVAIVNNTDFYPYKPISNRRLMQCLRFAREVQVKLMFDVRNYHDISAYFADCRTVFKLLEGNTNLQKLYIHLDLYGMFPRAPRKFMDELYGVRDWLRDKGGQELAHGWTALKKLKQAAAKELERA